MSHSSRQMELLQIAMNDLPTGAFICDNKGIVRFINKAYANYLGIQQQDALGKHILSLIPTSGIPRVLKSGNAELRQIRRFPNGATLLVNRVPLFNDQGELLGALSMTLFDTTMQVQELLESVKNLDKEISCCQGKIKSAFASPYTLDSIIGKSEAIRGFKDLLQRYARTNASVLILGGTGTGKELAAGAIHAISSRSNAPFVSINCAAIPNELFESEFFGYAPGAFSGARREGQIGKIEIANGGTLFLDEVGDLSISAQTKFLRALENKQICRLGSSKPVDVDFRLVAATNRELEKMIEAGTFREDLYYRINSMKLRLPPLCERKEDIPLLARHFLEHMGLGHVEISAEAMRSLENYSWPGNIRELRNAVGQAASLCLNGRIEPCDLPEECRKDKNVSHGALLRHISRTAEDEAILNALETCKGCKTRAAAMLGISRAALYVRLKKMGPIPY